MANGTYKEIPEADRKVSEKSVNVRHTAQPAHKPRIRPLIDPVILYVDKKAESKRAKSLLEQAGIEPFVTEGPVGALKRKPLALWCGGKYQGLDKICGLVSLLEFWSAQDIERGIFKNK